MVGVKLIVRGTVQGVGYRPFVYRCAVECGITGRVFNDAAGVIIEAFGEEPQVREFVDRITLRHPPLAVVRSVERAAISMRSRRTLYKHFHRTSSANLRFPRARHANGPVP